MLINSFTQAFGNKNFVYAGRKQRRSINRNLGLRKNGRNGRSSILPFKNCWGVWVEWIMNITSPPCPVVSSFWCLPWLHWLRSGHWPHLHSACISLHLGGSDKGPGQLLAPEIRSKELWYSSVSFWLYTLLSAIKIGLHVFRNKKWTLCC